MVRNGFDRADLMSMPQVELLEWHKVLRSQLVAESEARKKAVQKKKR